MRSIFYVRSLAIIALIGVIIAVQVAELRAAQSTATPTPFPPTWTPTLTPEPTATQTLAVEATGTATPTPTALPDVAETGATVHIVAEFDTLFSIALAYNVTIEALALANDLDVNDFLSIGQQIIIPDDTVTVVDTTQTATDAVSPADIERALAGESEEAAEDTTVTATDESVPAAAANTDAASDTVVPTLGLGAVPNITHGAGVNPLTGLRVDPAVLQHRPLMVRVGNDPVARTALRNLNKADVVYEEITEWWLTRFTAVFLTHVPDVVGPIRSARLVNILTTPQYQGALVHSGGSDPVRWEISQTPMVDLDEFFHPTPYFYRPNEGWQTRLSADLTSARDYMAANGMDAAVSLRGFVFSEQPEGGQPAESAYIRYPSGFTEWHYDSASGKYQRWTSGNPLLDAADGSQIAASNVVVYFAEHQTTDIVEDSSGATSVRILVNGQGVAWFFRDGLLTQGFWQTNGSQTPYFSTEAGDPYKMKPGNTWIEVVPTSYTIGLNSADEATTR